MKEGEEEEEGMWSGARRRKGRIEDYKHEKE
jgi:hypothetical protein